MNSPAGYGNYLVDASAKVAEYWLATLCAVELVVAPLGPDLAQSRLDFAAGGQVAVKESDGKRPVQKSDS